MTLWKDLINIPTEVLRNDFVLKLAEGVEPEHQQKTVDNYVVTSQIAERFGETLALIQTAVDTNRSMAAYLHGSFGSGKSHFMAILNLLLAGFPAARRLENLGGVVAKHQAWMDQHNFLMIPYNFMGATSMESAILGGYVDYVRRHHPDAPLPGVYPSVAILNNADALRTGMGDAAFFARLNQGHDDRWGDLATAWDAASYQEAREALPGSERQTSLVGDVVKHLITAAGNADEYVGLAEGLQTISRHAKQLTVPNRPGAKYDGLILFLDELILWLTSRAGDLDFVAREAAKIALLIESQYVDRPIPIISFVAKQRALQEFIDVQYMGQDQDRVWQQLQYFDRGLDTIALTDNDLPAVVQQRLLKPRGADAREQIIASFEQTVQQMKDGERDVLLGASGNRQLFAAVYPFSPALLQALIPLSALLHRERTALRLLLVLLVRQREELKLGEVIPVGDLWDVISEHHEPFSDVIRQTFRSAQALYTQRLRPMLLRHFSIAPDERAEDHPNFVYFRNDDRIVKTLLIATLIPGEAQFRGLTVSRLVALNYGSVVAFIPGGEAGHLLHKLRMWQADIGEIRVGDEPGDPSVSLQLSNIDIDALLQREQLYNNVGNRRGKAQALLYRWLGLGATNDVWTDYKLDWRGASRTIRVGYMNVRTQPVERFDASDRFQLLIDFPFDDDGMYPADDRAKLLQYLDHFPKGTNTLAWLPSFFSAEGTRLLGRLVVIEHVLTRFDQHVEHVSASDRPTVRAALIAQRNTIEAQLEGAMKTCYGINPDPDSRLVDHVNKPTAHLESLRLGFNPRVMAGVEFREALQKIAEGALGALYPGAPRLPHETLTRGTIEKMANMILDIVESGEPSGVIQDHATRKLFRSWAVPLHLGEMGEDRFAPGPIWRDRFNASLSTGDDPVTVAELRVLIEPADNPRGLPAHLQDLIILVYAAQENFVFRVGGAPIEPRIGHLPDQATLIHRKMPSDEAWERTVDVAKRLFDISAGRVKNARNVERIVERLRRAAEGRERDVKELGERFVDAGAQLGLDRDQVVASDRHRAARLLVELVSKLDLDAADAITQVAAIDASNDDLAAMRLTLERAASLNGQLKSTEWNAFARLPHEGGGAALRAKAVDVLTRRETEETLGQFSGLVKRAIDLLAEGAPPQPQPPQQPREQQPQRPVSDGEAMFRANSAAQIVTEINKWLAADDTSRALIEQGVIVEIVLRKVAE